MKQLSRSRYGHWLVPGIKVIPLAAANLLSLERFDRDAPEFVKLFFDLEDRLMINGEDNIPKSGPVYFITEHRNILDPVYMVDAVIDITGGRRWPHYIMRDNFAKGLINHLAKKYFRAILLTRDSGGDRSSRYASLDSVLDEAAQVLADDGCVAICPAATRSKSGSIYDMFLSERNRKKAQGLKKAELRKYRIDELAVRAGSFMRRFTGRLSIVPVGITFNDINNLIYLNFGEPISYHKEKAKCDREIMQRAVRDISRLKMIGLNQLIPAYFYEYERKVLEDYDPINPTPDRITKKYYTSSQGITMIDLYHDLEHVLIRLKKDHKHFDRDISHDPDKPMPGLKTFQDYLNHFEEEGTLILQSTMYYQLSPHLRADKAAKLEVSTDFKKESSALFCLNELEDVPGFSDALDMAFPKEPNPLFSRRKPPAELPHYLHPPAGLLQ